jgi:hypothetical protein
MRSLTFAERVAVLATRPRDLAVQVAWRLLVEQLPPLAVADLVRLLACLPLLLLGQLTRVAVPHIKRHSQAVFIVQQHAEHKTEPKSWQAERLQLAQVSR